LIHGKIRSFPPRRLFDRPGTIDGGMLILTHIAKLMASPELGLINPLAA